MNTNRLSRRSHLLIAAALLGAPALFAAPAANAQTLTDITLFRLDSNNDAIVEGANTRGSSFDGGGISNLYLLLGGSFVNSGDAAGVNVAIDLSVPATYTYSFVMANVNGNTGTPLGINFFFDNNTAVPAISARGPQGGGFVADGGVTRTPLFAPVTGANTLTFFNNGRQITLSDFAFQTTGGPDRVSSFNNAPDGSSDTNGSFTLTVTAGTAAAPEPGTMALLAVGTIPLLGLIRRKSIG